MNYPTKYDDVIDSRDIIEAIAELDGTTEPAAPSDKDEIGWADTESTEYVESLKALAKEGADYAEDWKYGVQLIRDSYFVTAMQELCEEVGYIPNDFPAWIHIDWEWTAKEMRYDYSAIDFDGVTYWVR